MTLRFLVAFMLLLPVAALAGPPQYSVWILPSTSPLGQSLEYSGINNNGQVGANDQNHNIYLLDPVLGFQYLGTPQPNNGYAYAGAVNDTGYVMVNLYTPGGAYALVMGGINIPGYLQLPGLTSDVIGSTSHALNDAGQVVGNTYTGTYAQQNVAPHAALWFADTAYDLGTLPGGVSSSATAINMYGVTAGWSYASDGKQHGAMFGGGTVTDLGILPGGSFAYVNAINSTGTCVGFGANSAGVGRAILFSGGTVQDLGALPTTSLYPSSDAVGIADDGVIVGYSNVYPGDGSEYHGWVLSNGTMYDLTTLTGISCEPTVVNSSGQILAEENVPPYNYVVLTPIPQILTVTVSQRVDGGSVPDGTVVKLLNNDGTALSPPTSKTTVGGVVTFTNPPSPAGSNTTYEVEVCVPSGGKGVPAVENNVSLGSTTVYFTAVKGDVVQSLISAPPVALATCRIDGVSVVTGTNGMTPAVWLPDGTYSGCSLSMSPGRPCTFTLTLGASSSTNLVAYSGYAGFLAHMTRVYMTARNSNGTTFIPKTGTWSITPGALSGAVNGQVISPEFWLPNGTYTGSLSGAASDGSSSFNVGTATSSGQRTVVVGSGP